MGPWTIEIVGPTKFRISEIRGTYTVTRWEIDVGHEINNAYVSGEYFVVDCVDGLRIYDSHGCEVSRTFR